MRANAFMTVIVVYTFNATKLNCVEGMRIETFEAAFTFSLGNF